jgi:ribonuclease T2
MKQIAFIASLAILLPLAGCGPHQQNPPTGAATSAANSDSGQGAASPHAASSAGFDFYLLNLSWSPEFCFSHPSAAECASHPAFVLHGMWPQNNDGTYPENCSNAPGPSDPDQYKDIYADQGLLAHEWRAHGTCSGLGADAFFSAARAAYRSVTIPPTLSGLTSQTSLPPDQILDLFTVSNPAIPRSSLALSCGHNYLTAVEVCLDKSLHPIACSAVRSCRANTVRIPPPGQ